MKLITFIIAVIVVLLVYTFVMYIAKQNLTINMVASLLFALVILGLVAYFLYDNIRSRDEKILINNNLCSETIDFSKLKKISRQTQFFEKSKYVNCYVDEQNLYISKDNATAKFPLDRITEISKTFMSINKIRIWQVKVKDKNDEILTFYFAIYVTLWKRDYIEFLEKMKAMNADVVKSKFSWIVG